MNDFEDNKLFLNYAGDNLDRWKELLDIKIFHKTRGKGVMENIERDADNQNIYLSILFETADSDGDFKFPCNTSLFERDLVNFRLPKNNKNFDKYKNDLLEKRLEQKLHEEEMARIKKIQKEELEQKEKIKNEKEKIEYQKKTKYLMKAEESEEQNSLENKTRENILWGFNYTYGWLILDRNIPQNNLKIERNILLEIIICSNWKTLEIPRGGWIHPFIRKEKKYLYSLEFQDFKKEYEELRRLKKEYMSEAKNIKSSIVKEKNKKFLSLHGKSSKGVRNSRKRRKTHCYNCPTNLDNIVDLEHIDCGWIICGSCGACGCGYNKNWN
jgi:hypothetical protein